jgi:TolB-like protein/Flp pilus assembly protein TadD
LSDPNSSRIHDFFSELRRRKVYRLAAGYCVVGWLLIQFATTVFPVLSFPEWVIRLVVVLILAGFPLALICAWAFDIGRAGIKVTPERVSTISQIPVRGARRRNLVALILIGLTTSLVAGYFLLAAGLGRPREKSIAVLPFTNFSNDAANEFFSDGIQDDVLTNLARIGDLKVISRTSVMPYRGQSHNIREIGKTLNVATVLEGSVRREGNRVRINVQLIDATTDQHLWAQVYDRELTDVFAIQSDLAHEIAAALDAKLSRGEQERIENRPTQVGEAYLLYIQANDIFDRPDRQHAELARAETLYEKALQLDPRFVLAHAQLSHLESWIYYAIEPVESRKTKARRAAEEAIRLQPDLAEARLALGYVYYYVDRDYQRAMEEFRQACRGLPNDAGVFRAMAAIQRRQGRWNESIASYEKAASLDPRNPILLENFAMDYLALRDYPAAARVLDRAVAASPDSFTIRALRARVEFESKGDLRPTLDLLATMPETTDPNGTITLTRYNFKMYERKYDEVLGILDRSPAQTSRGETNAPIPKSFLKATVYALKKDTVNARASYEEARVIAERAVQESPQDGPRHALLGLIYAGLGRCEEATAEGKRAVELLPETTDAFDGPILAISRARIAMTCGDNDTAIELLDRSLVTPYGMPVHELRLDPTWDKLRADPRFQQLLAKHGGTK